MPSNVQNNLEAKLIYNDPKNKIKVLNELNKCLNECDSFAFSVAFINGSGLSCINQEIFNLGERGIKGRLITSTYLDFNSPQIFRNLLKYKNMEVRIFKEKEFHPKGYLFTKGEERKIIIGSSNITGSALSTNQEWNILIDSHQHQSMVSRTEEEFEEQWKNSEPLTVEWIDKYEKEYQPIIDRKKDNNAEKSALLPNSMQEKAMLSLAALRKEGNDRALLISATGTGKTYLSAFDVKQFNAKKVLFVVHRESIARDAMETFLNVMPDKRCGLFCGSDKSGIDKDFVFSTIQTIGKEEYLNKFERNHFDYIIIDEVHHLGADSYQLLFSYFNPKFMLGMTATPERTDGYDIFKDFNYNIAYEIRLQQAMEEDLICPFHYYGVCDLEIEGESIKDLTDVKYLTRKERVKHIIEAAEKYSFSGDKVHGLLFVSRVDEAIKISELLNKEGYRTAPITSDTSDVEHAIDLLESNDENNCYDYLVCVDKFNEGIDIPCVNQIIMARPTHSAIVFVQQLGRGLRKAINKEYTVIIDIIGNYTNNFLIPVALSGDRTYNVDTIKKYMITGKQFLPGSSTINFDIISKKRIFDSIDNISSIRNKYNELISNSYDYLYKKLGRRPYLLDFYKNGEIDPMLIIERKKSYYEMILKQGENNIVFDTEMIMTLRYLSKNILDGKRKIELIMLKTLLIRDKISTKEMKTILACSDDELEFSINLLKGGFDHTDENIEKNKCFALVDRNELYIYLTDGFKSRLENEEFKKEIDDIVDTGLEYYEDNYEVTGNDYPFVLSKKYTRKDVCRLLNCHKDLSSIVYGMYVFDSGDACIFVTYNKENPLDESNYVEGKPDYADYFSDENTFEWETKVGNGIDSVYTKNVENAKCRRLFIKKDDNEDSYYYIGKINIANKRPSQKEDNNKKMKDTAKITFFLESPIKKNY